MGQPAHHVVGLALDPIEPIQRGGPFRAARLRFGHTRQDPRTPGEAFVVAKDIRPPFGGLDLDPLGGETA